MRFVSTAQACYIDKFITIYNKLNCVGSEHHENVYN